MMATSEKIADEFLMLVQRFIRLRPKLSLPDEHVASLKRQFKELKDVSNGAQEDRIFLFRIPLMLMHRETPPTMGEVSAELGIPLSSATRMADWLVRAKIVQRCDDPHDRRIVRLCMTEHGEELMRMGASYMRLRIGQLLIHFTAEEQGQLLRL